MTCLLHESRSPAVQNLLFFFLIFLYPPLDSAPEKLKAPRIGGLLFSQNLGERVKNEKISAPEQKTVLWGFDNYAKFTAEFEGMRKHRRLVGGSFKFDGRLC